MLEKAMEMEKAAVRDYNKYANECSANADAASKMIFEHLVGDEEGHADAFETLLEQVDKFGEQFLALQAIERTRNLAGGD
jgi:bacterioferritin